MTPSWRHRSGSTLAQVIAWCRQVTSHYPSQCWHLISKILWHTPQSNFTAKSCVTYYSIFCLKTIVLKLLAHLLASDALINILNAWWNQCCYCDPVCSWSTLHMCYWPELIQCKERSVVEFIQGFFAMTRQCMKQLSRDRCSITIGT